MIKKLATQYKESLLILATVLLVVLTARIAWLHVFSFLALLPFAFLLQNPSAKKATQLAALCAVLFWIGTSYWLVPANINFARSSPLLTSLVFLLFCFWQALPYSVLAWFYSQCQWRLSALGPLLAATCLTLAWVIIPSPLPWLPINSLYTLPKFVAVLDLSGMSLLLFLSAFYCFSIEYVSRKQAAYKKVYCVLLAAIPVLMLTYGELRQYQLDKVKEQAGAEQWLSVGYIQPNLRFSDSFDRTYLVTERLILNHAPELIVWPEISSPFSIDDNPRQRAEVFALAEKYQQDMLVVSGYIYTDNYIDERRTYYNQAQLIKDQAIEGRYSKEILVPFFEYLPKPLSFLRQWMPNVLIYQAGENQQPLAYKDNIKLALVICYEVIFPSYVRKQIQKGANILINPSSDAAFGDGIGGYYHLSTAYFRTIENRVPWVRATNTGTSLIVGADGRALTEASKSNVVALDAAKVYLPVQASVYGRIGDWFSFVLLALSVGYFAYWYSSKRS